MKIKTAFITLFLFTSTLAYGAKGTEGGGGGDDVALEFQQAFAKMIAKSKINSEDLYDLINRESLTSVAEKAQIIVIDKDIPVEVQGLIQNSIAYNDPETNRILINRERWSKIKQAEIREAIALHEIASLARLESTGIYPLSTKYLLAVGGKKDEFITHLTVDQLKQMIVENPEMSKQAIIQKLYKQSQVASVEDIPYLSQAKNYWGGCAIYDPRDSGDRPTPYVVAKFTGKLVQKKYDTNDGPLFSQEGNDKKILIIEGLFPAFVDKTKVVKGDYYPNIEFLEGSGITTKEELDGYAGSFSSSTISSSFTSNITLKTDKKYLYFKYSSTAKGERGMPHVAYGYCWKR